MIQPPHSTGSEPLHAAVPVAIALGSNLGRREANLNRALSLLDGIGGLEVLAVSHLYESAPWGDTNQPEFLNAVVAGRTGLGGRELLLELQRIEAALGKRVVRHWGPRVMDLDLLLLGRETVSAPELTLPHPYLASRPFVYLPLREVTRAIGAEAMWAGHLEANADGQAAEGGTRRLAPRTLWPARAVPHQWYFEAHSEEQTMALGRRLGAVAAAGVVFALAGPLGAGKSCLVRGIGQGLGVGVPMPSPSFTLCREYAEGRLPLQHWDFYRMEDAGDLESAGFDPKSLADGIAAIEWADLFDSELEAVRPVRIHLEPAHSADQRRIEFHFPPGSLALRAALAEFGGDPAREAGTS